MFITENIKYVGVNDHTVDLFEGQYAVKNGMSYNSYVIIDEKVAVLDTVDAAFGDKWLENLAEALGGRKPDYLIVQHMEPDHSANVARFVSVYPGVTVAASAKAFPMMKQYFGVDYAENRLTIADGDTLSLGGRTLAFRTAPMVHWPEVIVTYDVEDKILFSADGFGKFGALDVEEPWDDEARRYYIGIVGKYGAQVQALLKKAAELDIAKICPLHGPVLSDNLTHYLGLYDAWSSYTAECGDIVVAYASVYGHTRAAALLLADKLRANGKNVRVYDLARCDMAEAVASAFACGTLVLASLTYNSGVFPFMRTFIEELTERGYKNRRVALIENGTWAPQAAKTMLKMLEGAKDIAFAENTVKIMSALNEKSEAELEALAAELSK